MLGQLKRDFFGDLISFDCILRFFLVVAVVLLALFVLSFANREIEGRNSKLLLLT
jgi:hypothetical protein